MGLQLSSTGSVTEDISNIIDGLNSVSDNDSISNVLNIVAYGIITIVVPDTPGITTTVSFLHNLRYFPLFIVKAIAVDNTNLSLPIFIDGYVFPSGTKANGTYPYAFINITVDEQKLNVLFTNLTNAPGFVAFGQLSFSFLLFSRPIHG